MKVIFLDIDGVICNRKCWSRKEVMSDGNHYFDGYCLKLLENIIDKTDAYIVISSSWRTYTRKMQETFRLRGFKYYDRIIDQTPRLQLKEQPYEKWCSVPRGLEILTWLENNPQVKNYVILDDDSDMLYWQRKNFVKTSTELGLQLFDKFKAIHILKRK